MIRAARLPEFEIVGNFDVPLPASAVDAIADMLLAAADASTDLHDGESDAWAKAQESAS